MKQLNHQASEPLERARDANRRADLDEDALGGVNVYLKLAGLVDWRVQKSEEALQRGQMGEARLAVWVRTW